MTDPALQAVLDFWFGAKGSPEYGAFRDIWFRAATPEFDRDIRARFLAAHERAASGALDAAMDDAEGALALLILLDQFPRNMFRGTARAFATDVQARAVAHHAIARDFDRQVPAGVRLFFYLPFEHSESLADQDFGIARMRALGDDRTLKFALEHRDVIAHFGRFPHRNAVLGRASTADEIEFLKTAEGWGQGQGQAAASAG